jgi:hypothetical protein
VFRCVALANDLLDSGDAFLSIQCSGLGERLGGLVKQHSIEISQYLKAGNNNVRLDLRSEIRSGSRHQSRQWLGVRECRVLSRNILVKSIFRNVLCAATIIAALPPSKLNSVC